MNIVQYIKDNKGRIIKTALIVTGTVAAITLVGFIASRGADVEVTELES